MKLRFAADRRALFWALVLFPLVPALALLNPALLPWLVPFSIYLSYCAGVLTHNHVHAPVFVNKRMNALYGAWLSFFYGAPIFTWIPTHNQNHHRYLNGPGDLTRSSNFATKDTLLAALAYPTRSTAAQLPEVARFMRATWRGKSARSRQIAGQIATLVLGHSLVFALAVALHGLLLGALVYGIAVALPAALASWSMMFTNYVQHVGCDPHSADNHSRNFVSPWLNWLVFEAGYHTVHHEHPGTHWSRYPALHAARADRIDPRLNQRTILGYCLKTYVFGEGHEFAAETANARADAAS
ncbi:MAG TPA: fatty acid desaturase [Polyangiaceae bacterium]|nr:fatty acid desaturase [Polyangiaceae bacterium]